MKRIPSADDTEIIVGIGHDPFAGRNYVYITRSHRDPLRDESIEIQKSDLPAVIAALENARAQIL